METHLISAIPAIFSAIAACAAAYATWFGPVRAARLAEELRRQQDAQLEQRREKMKVFLRLMETRATRIDKDSVAAFNLIDLVFIESPSVRDAWAELFSAYSNPVQNFQYQRDKLLALLRAMATDLGLASDLRSADFERIYYPNALVHEDRARVAQQKAAIGQLSGALPDVAQKSIFPPPPAID